MFLALALYNLKSGPLSPLSIHTENTGYQNISRVAMFYVKCFRSKTKNNFSKSCVSISLENVYDKS